MLVRGRFVLALAALIATGCGEGPPGATPTGDVPVADAGDDITAPEDREVPGDQGGAMDVPDAPFDRTEPPDAARDGTTTDALDARPDIVFNDRSPGDVPDARDVSVGPPPAWGLDTRPVNTTCVAFARPTAGTGVQVTRVFPNLPAMNLVVGMHQAPRDDSRWFVLEQSGRLLTFSNTPAVSRTDVFIDLTSRVVLGSESGLLGMAFHPNWATNRQVFLSYTGPRRAGQTEVLVSRVSRFVSRDNGATLDPASEQVLLEVSQPFNNHNGGGIAFGPDGMLYVGFGDGGDGGDPYNHGQTLTSLLGKFLRLDVDRTSPGRAYAIPADNPFASGVGGRPEIWAWGFRNPWRWSFDRATGELWAGDVGQSLWEEVDLVRRGGNYGWRVMEGNHCYRATTCNEAGLVRPVVEYDHSVGVSITGGYVYRGARIPWLVGSFVYGDFQTGRVFAVTSDRAGATVGREIAAPAMNISTFAEDQSGELYAVDYRMGRLFRLDPGATLPVDTVPPTIRATGCVTPDAPLRPAAGLIPYAPNAPFWSDGADKERYLALPAGARITVQPDGDWDLPVGTVLVKNFSYRGRRIETRLFVRHADGEWAGYSYSWNDAQTDATPLPGAATRDLGGGVRWYYPSRAQCMACHTSAAGRTLGLETAQLNGDLTYPATGRTSNQLTTFEHLGLFANALPATRPRLPSPTGLDPLEARARAYLHTNCAQCHRPGGTGRGTADFRFTTAANMLGVCNVAPSAGDLGVTGARVVLPGDPARSILSVRVRATDLNRMPPISSNVVDTAGATLLDDWIRALRACP